MDVVNERQIDFGKRLGLDLRGKSQGVAEAMIQDAIDTQFHGRNNLGAPTIKQQALASSFGYDIAEVSKRVGNAVIDDIMMMLNREAILKYELAPGVVVVNKHDTLQRRRTISSIKDDGTVYFRGGNGARAWARSLIRQG